MLTSDELTAMRATQAAAQPETVTIQRVTRAADGFGGQTETWATVATTTGRKAPPSSGQELRYAERWQGVRVWIVALPQGTDVTASDRLVIGAATLHVEEVMAPHTWETARRAWCTEAT